MKPAVSFAFARDHPAFRSNPMAQNLQTWLGVEVIWDAPHCDPRLYHVS